ncbi:MAG: hypothetical protein QOD92_806 [Acidimicrobiaceae bacterium]
MSAGSDFEQWSAPKLIETGPAVRTDAVRAWLQEVFDAEGPINDARLAERAADRQLALAKEAVDLVMSDAARSEPGVDLEVTVDAYEGSLRISVDGSFETPSMLEWERAAAIAEVASYLQEYLCEKVRGTWPTCSMHDLGLHATTRDGVALWLCTEGPHTVTVIGGLEARG